MTHIYLLIGCLWPLCYCQGHRLSADYLVTAGLVALCIGDSFVR